jgi:uncharacterized UPF0160 family protein
MALPPEGALTQLIPRPDARLLRAGPVEWAVYEHCHSYVGRSLIFESDRVVRRVRNYPANWRDLTDEQLREVSLCP